MCGDGWLARGSRGGWSSSAAAMGRPPGSVLRRAGGKAMTTCGRASSLGAGGSFRRAWGTRIARRGELTGTAPMVDGGGVVLTRVKTEGFLWMARGGWGAAWAHVESSLGVGRGMAGVRWTGRRRARAGPGYGGDAVGRSAQVGFTRPVSVRCVVMEGWE
jgi:hypothetical protein